MIVLVVGLLALAAAGCALAVIGVGSREGSRATYGVRAALWALALLVVVEAALGACGRLDAKNTLIALLVAAIAVTTWSRRRPIHPIRGKAREPWSITAVALALAIAGALALRFWSGLHRTSFLYDALSYHLHAPVTWFHDRRLEIVPAVFGDPAPAYAPSNVELWFLFLLAPLRSDYLAGSGQLPFAALAVLAIAATVRESGGSRAAALGAGLAFLLVPEIWQQAPTAMTDLGLAALLLASLPFAVRLSRSGAAADRLACAAALGLTIGSKYVGLVLAMPFGAAALIAAAKNGRTRLRHLLAPGAVVLATGGFWYARNAIVTGNPIYPVSAFGLPGLYGRAAMRAWDYHLPATDLAAFGAMLAAAGLGFLIAAAIGLGRARPPIELALSALFCALFWIVVPYQESRFLFAAFGLAAVALGRTAARSPAWLGWGALAVAIGGGLIEFPTSERLALVPLVALGAAAAIARRRFPPSLRRPIGVGATFALVVAAGTAMVVGLTRYRTADPGYAIGDDVDGAWSWVGANVHDAQVAYAGNNLALPLAGRHLGNRVAYVNVAGGPSDLLHDFARRRPPTISGAPTPEPAPYRDGADFQTWLRNLRAAGSQVLFVAAMDPIVKRNIPADQEGFPVERAWADAHPALFTPRYTSPAARIYGVHLP